MYLYVHSYGKSFMKKWPGIRIELKRSALKPI